MFIPPDGNARSESFLGLPPQQNTHEGEMYLMYMFNGLHKSLT